MDIRTYLKGRCLTDEVIDAVGLKEQLSGIVPIVRGIAIPIRSSSGEFLFNKYRRHPLDDDTDKPKYVYDKGAKVTVAFYDLAKKHKHIYITEGEFDALALQSLGLGGISSTGGCSSFRIEWIQSLLRRHETVTIIYDNDEPGMKALGMLMNKARMSIRSQDRKGLHFGLLPEREGVKDITDLISIEKAVDPEFNAKKFLKLLRVYSVSPVGVAAACKPVKKLSWYSAEGTLLDVLRKAYTMDDNLKVVTKRGNASPERDMSKLQRAKEYPIPNLIQVNSQSKARCVWHEDHDPSMHYYKKDNRVKCFACGGGGDVLDLYRQIHGCSLAEAIEKLS